eukprot:TRINITY_DN4597_c0_g1_i1.p1 TRINITY_DN4597_c0_g1~~TRINITY_DN4597_c0_g1_i1.p1  ORF type:complete len:233 (+),score=55.01 TRINITY_DN4597_c0_g1_i1:43-699(+)
MEAEKKSGNRKRAYSRAPPPESIRHSNGVEYLIYRLGKVVEDGYIQREAFVHTVEDVVCEASANSGLRVPIEDVHGELYEIFDTYDKKGTKKVTLSELSTGLHVVLEGTDDEKVKFAFNEIDKNGDGRITANEFLQFFKHYFEAKLSVESKGSIRLSEERWKLISEHLSRAFAASDTNKDGTVDGKEFMKAVNEDPDHPFCLVLDAFAALSAPLRGPM